jgi:GNAT superfamily N-acetyltransferase
MRTSPSSRQNESDDSLPHSAPRHRRRPAGHRGPDPRTGRVFEKLEHLVEVTPESLQPHLFGPSRRPRPWWCEVGGEVVAFALFFTNFPPSWASRGFTWKTCTCSPRTAALGLGKALLQHLAALAVARGCGRFEWSVLDWNANAIRFYERMGATVMPDWRICRVTGQCAAGATARERSAGRGAAGAAGLAAPARHRFFGFRQAASASISLSSGTRTFTLVGPPRHHRGLAVAGGHAQRRRQRQAARGGQAGHHRRGDGRRRAAPPRPSRPTPGARSSRAGRCRTPSPAPPSSGGPGPA